MNKCSKIFLRVFTKHICLQEIPSLQEIFRRLSESYETPKSRSYFAHGDEQICSISACHTERPELHGNIVILIGFHELRIRQKTIYERHVLRRCQNVGNKAKGRISKRVFQENKVSQIFRNFTCAYQGVRNVRFSGNLACFVFLKHPFWDLPFALLPAKCMNFSEKP